MKRTVFTLVFLFVLSVVQGQSKGSLFIIGGGERSAALMTKLVETANMSKKDYIVILPMATGVPEESVPYVSNQFSALCSNAITSFNFTREEADSRRDWIDSVRHARLIYIVGGDQNKFMAVVKNTSLYDAMHEAFRKGATVSGTSAGAAVMSEIMITGAERDSTDKAAFREIKSDNVITSLGMGFITKAIIDQHFVKRSRYNRLLSILADHPDKIAIGIDESTAIIVKGNMVQVTGESQVVVVSDPQKLKSFNGNRVAFKNAKLFLYVEGDSFKIK